MNGYYKRPEKTAETIDAEGWLHTGDYGRIDEGGNVFVTGRISRTIILSSGKKVAPEELEDKISVLPGVMEVMVSGDGEKRSIKAEIYASQNEEVVRGAVSSLNLTLPVYQRIDTVIFRKEPFDRTSSGKIKLR
jgi:long-chain acyl-CoA synthetase